MGEASSGKVVSREYVAYFGCLLVGVKVVLGKQNSALLVSERTSRELVARLKVVEYTIFAMHPSRRSIGHVVTLVVKEHSLFNRARTCYLPRSFLSKRPNHGQIKAAREKDTCAKVHEENSRKHKLNHGRNPTLMC